MPTSAHHLGAPVVRLREEAVADFGVDLGLEVVMHVVALAVDLLREVGDERRVE